MITKNAKNGKKTPKSIKKSLTKGTANLFISS